jgi:hypothetical protein
MDRRFERNTDKSTGRGNWQLEVNVKRVDLWDFFRGLSINMIK